MLTYVKLRKGVLKVEECAYVIYEWSLSVKTIGNDNQFGKVDLLLILDKGFVRKICTVY